MPPGRRTPTRTARAARRHTARSLATLRAVLIGAVHSGRVVVGNIVELKARRGAANETRVFASAELRALQQLQELCEKAIAAGGLDAGGPTALDFTVAVHRATKGTGWSVRFHRGEASG